MKASEAMNIVIFGSIPLATKMLKYFLERDDVNVVAVVCERSHRAFRNHYFNEPATYTIAADKGIRVAALEELSDIRNEVNFDLGFSGRFNRIISKGVLELFKVGVVNMHGGPLPEYRGVHGNIHAILNGEETFGAALHFMDEGVDTGAVIAQERFAVDELDTGFDVFSKTQIAQWNLFLDNIEDILAGREERKSQGDMIEAGAESKTYRKRDIVGRKEVSLSMQEEELLRRVRAFDFPGHIPCFARIGGHKVYLRVREMEGT